eukprot:6201320-Pleurochrysis_carterae.AAC.3
MQLGRDCSAWKCCVKQRHNCQSSHPNLNLTARSETHTVSSHADRCSETHTVRAKSRALHGIPRRSISVAWLVVRARLRARLLYLLPLTCALARLCNLQTSLSPPAREGRPEAKRRTREDRHSFRAHFPSLSRVRACSRRQPRALSGGLWAPRKRLLVIMTLKLDRAAAFLAVPKTRWTKLVP